HVIFGVIAGGVTTSRLNFDDILFEDLRWFNAPVDVTGAAIRSGIHLATHHAAAGEGTQTSITNVTCRRVRGEGSNEGIYIGGTYTGAITGSMNAYVDNLVLEQCWHS